MINSIKSNSTSINEIFRSAESLRNVEEGKKSKTWLKKLEIERPKSLFMQKTILLEFGEKIVWSQPRYEDLLDHSKQINQ